MARKVKFPLIMPDGAVVRDPDELKMHFDLPTVLEYYKNGKLAEWLDNCLYTEEATRVRELVHSSEPDLGPMLCDILGVTYTKPDGGEETLDRRKRLAQLRQYTTDESILAAVDHVAFSQEELVRLLEKEPDIKEIYLCGERFAIPKYWDGITYIGVNHPQVYIRKGLRGITAKQVEESSDLEEFQPEQLWRSLAEQGHAIAQNELGNHLKEQDAFQWFMKAAEQGLAQGQTRVGICYYDGDGVAVDKEKAFQWFLKAAEQGLADAQCILAECYRSGDGIAVDKEKAFQWFLKAAKQGDDNARFRLDKYFRSLAKNPEKAFKWLLKAAEQGLADAQYTLAMCYRYGKGVAEDKEKAFQWYKRAAEQGHAEAQRMLKLL